MPHYLCIVSTISFYHYFNFSPFPLKHSTIILSFLSIFQFFTFPTYTLNHHPITSLSRLTKRDFTTTNKNHKPKMKERGGKIPLVPETKGMLDRAIR